VQAEVTMQVSPAFYSNQLPKRPSIVFAISANIYYHQILPSTRHHMARRAAAPIIASITILNLNSFDFSQIFEICFELTSF
jgi:hypothetical protein